MDEFNWLMSLIGDSAEPISLNQMLARSFIIFLYGVFLLRITTPRIFSKATPVDIIVSVIIGSNLSRTLTGNAPFWEVMAVTTFLVALHATVMWAAARWRPFANLVKGRPKTLIRNGELDVGAKTGAVIGDRDLMAAIHSAGGERIADVRMATLERGGNIEVILKR